MNSPDYYHKAAEEIFRYALEAVAPENLVRRAISRKDSYLYIQGQEINLNHINRIFVAGAGKATAPMAKAIEEIAGDVISSGLIIVKYGHSVALARIRTIEAGHPVPDEKGISATQEMIRLMSQAGENDLVIMLLSGGGSALLADVPPKATLKDLQACFDLLLKSGASILEMNTVRKHLSQVKGGGLAKHIYPATLVTLILSDVTGDPLDVIASGPTVPDPSSFADAWSVIQRYGLEERIPPVIRQHLLQGLTGNLLETPKSEDDLFSAVSNYIIGSNTIALEAARQKATQMGFYTIIAGSAISGDAKQVVNQLLAIARNAAADPTLKKPVCLLMGGETTVTITGDGLGGRNQEFALTAALQLQQGEQIVILSAGTDGTDGPTDAAGAMIDADTVARARGKGLDAALFLNNNDSYHFFRQAGGHIITGPTRTNVMDIMLALVY